MDNNQYLKWIDELDKTSALIVPTRSLASTLKSQVADYYISLAKTVWEAPNILTWGDYLRWLWQLNAVKLSPAHTLISSQQSLLLWTQVVEASRRLERDLTLLNVQQTAKAVQRSWRLMHDWRLSEKTLMQEHVEDVEQFLNWLSSYRALLEKRGLIDEPLLVQKLLQAQSLEYPFKRLVWHSYDLVTTAQQSLNDKMSEQGVTVDSASSARAAGPAIKFLEYQNSEDEIRASLVSARTLIENSDSNFTINVVIPDLQRKQAKVREIAREVFYPAASPLNIQQMTTVYRFSLGQPLGEWAAIETALTLINMLKNRISMLDLGFVLRNQFIGLSREYSEECRLFERWLKSQRISNLLLDNLPALHEQFSNYLTDRGEIQHQTGLLDALDIIVSLRNDFQRRLDQRGEQNNFATISFQEWGNVFDQWLQAWRWSPEVESGGLDSIQYQLLMRWQGLLAEYMGLSAVQSSIGIARAIEVLRQMARDAVFQPQANASPILISGLYEAIGRPVNTCFLTGMNQHYPTSVNSDPFVPNRLLHDAGFPNATAEGNYIQARKVNQSLLAAAESAVVSYAIYDEQDREIEGGVSSLYRDQNFERSGTPLSPAQLEVELEEYQDVQGPAWASTQGPKGGSSIFENQSNCAFKAFVTHQLGFERDQEAEFGLDGLDRGNVVHRMLELAWLKIQTQSKLASLSEPELETIIANAVKKAILNEQAKLSADKAVLLQREQLRLSNILKNWLMLEAKRPLGFSVIESEQKRYGNIGGIEFAYIIDRIDQTDDGRQLIIDYKTGTVSRRDWTEERLAKPQMPLYSVMLNRAESRTLSGIAYAKVDARKNEFIELCETDILKIKSWRTQEYETSWLDGQARWGELFDELAEQFLAGDARVNPIEENTCMYCDLKSVCRVSQLRDSSQGAKHD